MSSLNTGQVAIGPLHPLGPSTVALPAMSIFTLLNESLLLCHHDYFTVIYYTASEELELLCKGVQKLQLISSQVNLY